MLAAETGLSLAVATAFDRGTHKFAHAVSVDADEGIAVYQSAREIFARSFPHRRAKPQCRLREIVGAKRRIPADPCNLAIRRARGSSIMVPIMGRRFAARAFLTRRPWPRYAFQESSCF